MARDEEIAVEPLSSHISVYTPPTITTTVSVIKTARNRILTEPEPVWVPETGKPGMSAEATELDYAPLATHISVYHREVADTEVDLLKGAKGRLRELEVEKLETTQTKASGTERQRPESWMPIELWEHLYGTRQTQPTIPLSERAQIEEELWRHYYRLNEERNTYATRGPLENGAKELQSDDELWRHYYRLLEERTHERRSPRPLALHEGPWMSPPPSEQTSPLGFSVELRAHEPPRKIYEELRPSSRQIVTPRSVEPRRERRLSPHHWTTVHERTTVSYVKRMTLSRSPIRGHAQSEPPATLYRSTRPAASAPTSKSPTGRSRPWTTFDSMQVHHPILPPRSSVPATVNVDRSQSMHREQDHHTYKKTKAEKKQRQTYTGAYSAVAETSHAAQVHKPAYYTHTEHKVYRVPHGTVKEIAAIDRTELYERVDSPLGVEAVSSNEAVRMRTSLRQQRVVARLRHDDERNTDYLVYQTSGLVERPIEQRMNELPPIEFDAYSCRGSHARVPLPPGEYQELDPRLMSEEELTRRRRPIKRARQRMRNICTML
ncbi:unnamed protein product, partial [Mesorhabditis belari]|uniref:Uncharacterized protein n=1 Tax=Mesorhabditis belari TaxID=2138241 RepID=A0AAF3FEE6_9BILA